MLIRKSISTEIAKSRFARRLSALAMLTLACARRSLRSMRCSLMHINAPNSRARQVCESVVWYDWTIERAACRSEWSRCIGPSRFTHCPICQTRNQCCASCRPSHWTNSRPRRQKSVILEGMMRSTAPRIPHAFSFPFLSVSFTLSLSLSLSPSLFFL